MKSVKLKKQERRDIILNENLPFSVKEAYNSIRTNLIYSITPKNNKILVISSPNPEEGKSITASNLAICLSQLQKKVVLIDGDLRKPVQHKNFHLDNRCGLSTVVAGFAPLDEAIKKDVVPNLDVITSGLIPPNPSELLGSDNMKALKNTLKMQYDYIIIDTPPINVVTDPTVLLEENTAVALVCKQKSTTYDELSKAIQTIKKTESNFIGVIVNSVKSNEKIYSNYRTYSYKY